MIVLSLKRFGITTGAAAAAAAKAATCSLLDGAKPMAVVVPTPIGLRLEIPIERYLARDQESCASVRKVAGDNPDVLDGAEVMACCSKFEGSGVHVEGGHGVGRVVRQGLRGKVGETAISPTAKQMIEQSVKEALAGRDQGVRVVVEVPDGPSLAANTMNPAVGIEGGVSILGTTGVEVPVSDEDYLDHIRVELCSLRFSSELAVLAPGNTSARVGRAIYGDVVVKVGDRIGESVSEAIARGFKRIVVVSMPGKLVKLASGIMNTHNRFGDARVETITHASVLAGVEGETLLRVASSKTVGEALTFLGEKKEVVMRIVAERALARLRELGSASLGVVACDEEGAVLAKVGDA
ncbi:cobalt-precorrin-5B (C(1))-methyltransferase [Sulfodiicoccus acidiphilus]|uniref:Cobalt-precorrin-5B C(1)-methyltransferase n=1 Tax=Sulfodiicoccus acidiphilus TaxID=1670455 RepID=A0A348B2N2_9CREN|nr:cobalt-precorrin-5B (C(1))-methyltransferase CbiD [Sulfodiicoccus acidiphilus]BBD72434.1 cobalt-precorrin-5B (C(1))-methyltransferase [Sulfodiicoccus acidiphilus]GGT97158.1 cobalt-precorrin-5B (C(1))-methyltransferase [Sulfodiicoccus acidiphilus]